jgi:GMP synthase (glutamine-hydrolysing)
MITDKILILDFGSQYTQLIARRVRELNVYCEIHPYNHLPELDPSIKGVIFSGSPFSVRDEDAPEIPFEAIQALNVPILGVCYGAQWIAHNTGGNVEASVHREYGRAILEVKEPNNLLLSNMSPTSQVWMSHGDTIKTIGPDVKIIASTVDVEIAAFQIGEKDIYCIQFHPEVTHSEEGKLLLSNFVRKICKCDDSWTPENFVLETVAELKEKLGDDEVILGLSGGVDSSVAAILLHKAIGPKLKCIFIDNGLLRKGEFEQVLDTFRPLGLNIDGVNASQEFYDALEGITEPEQKRKAIGKVFIDVFQREAHHFEGAKWLAQGTIYPDVIESVSVKGPSATIKSHHNVGGLPEDMHLKVVEPLRNLFKDEVRNVGRAMDMPSHILDRHPFPGPGLGIRILGDITPEKVHMLQEADHIYMGLLEKHNLYDQIWQAGTIFLPIQSVGVMGDERTYENVVALRAVNSFDGMTADWFHLPYDVLAEISNTIINRVKGINRVVYDISSKPPATIEWE